MIFLEIIGISSMVIIFIFLKELLKNKYRKFIKIRKFDKIENNIIRCLSKDINIKITEIKYEDDNDERLRTFHNKNLIVMIWKGYSDIWCVRMSYIDNDIIHLEYNEYRQILDVVSDMNTYKKWFPDYIRDKKINEILND